MPDVRLRRTDQQRLAGFASGAEDRAGGLGFDRVAERCPRAVGFEVADVTRLDAGARQRIRDDPLLGDAVRHGQATRCAVLVDRAAADHGPNAVAVGDRVIEAFDEDDATSSPRT